ncbi:hypothetical protein BC831DRAFT_273546 [Entophlyctis helioformis]|nr:hypothetical protein BC831DRAFT_273546 [Entophlyctis helioformis]
MRFTAAVLAALSLASLSAAQLLPNPGDPVIPVPGAPGAPGSPGGPAAPPNPQPSDQPGAPRTAPSPSASPARPPARPTAQPASPSTTQQNQQNQPAPRPVVGQPLAPLPTFSDPPRIPANPAAPQTASSQDSQPGSSLSPFAVVGVLLGLVVFGASGTFVYNKYIRKESDDDLPRQSKTMSRHQSVSPAGAGDVAQFATYPTLSKRGGPGKIQQQEEFIIKDESPKVGEDGLMYASYPTIGRSGGPGLVQQKEELTLVPHDHPVAVGAPMPPYGQPQQMQPQQMQPQQPQQMYAQTANGAGPTWKRWIRCRAVVALGTKQSVPPTPAAVVQHPLRLNAHTRI